MTNDERTKTMAKDHDHILRTKADMSLDTAVRRILKYWDRATPTMIGAGHIWYPNAREVAIDLAIQGHVTLETAVAVIAHLSPRTRWERNIMGAYAVLLKGDTSYLLQRNVAGANRALNSDDPISTLTGPKTRRFAANILGDVEAVTCDVWAAKVAGVSELQLNRKGVYDALEHAYRVAARRRGTDPCVMQAVCWIVCRGGRST